MHPNPEVRKLQRFLDGFIPQSDQLHVLEAGCGSTSQVTFHGGAHLTGIDISASQLERNAVLDEKILGDVQTYPLPRNHFDVIVSWDVLEHIPRPKMALENLMQATKSGGVIILGLPNACSVKGLITKYTPFRFHVWWHRHIYKSAVAGLEGHAPFPTYMKLSMCPSAIRKLAERNGMSVAYLYCYENSEQKRIREKLFLRGPVWNCLRSAVSIVSRGRISADLTECHIVLKRP